AGMMMFGVANPVEHRIAQPDIRRLHVDLRAQGFRAIRKFARFHSRKQIHVFLNGAAAKRTLSSEAAEFVRLVWWHFVDVSFSFADKLDGEVVMFVEVIRSVEWRAAEIFI